MSAEHFASEERAHIRHLRLVSLLEGLTLPVLVLVAVPAKHLFGFADATKLAGPVHGGAFALYVWMVIATVSGGGWNRAEIARLVLAAFVPFGAFANRGFLKRKEAALAGAGPKGGAE